MTKNQIKDGMIVEHREGHLGIWIGGTSITMRKGGHGSSRLNDDLTNAAGVAGWDIVRVYSPTKRDYAASLGHWLEDKKILQYCTVLWDRDCAVNPVVSSAKFPTTLLIDVETEKDMAILCTKLCAPISKIAFDSNNKCTGSCSNAPIKNSHVTIGDLNTFAGRFEKLVFTVYDQLGWRRA